MSNKSVSESTKYCPHTNSLKNKTELDSLLNQLEKKLSNTDKKVDIA